jgi:hypothetical protein
MSRLILAGSRSCFRPKSGILQLVAPIRIARVSSASKPPSSEDDIARYEDRAPASESEKQPVDPRKFFDLTPDEQREALRAKNERDIAEIRARREEMDQVSHHVPGFNQLSLGERLKVEKGLKAPLDVKAYLELAGFDLRRNELYPYHPQIGPAVKVTPYGRNFFFPYAWGVCLVSQIGFMPDVSILAAGAVAGLAMRIATTAGVAAHREYKGQVEHFDESKFFRIPTENLMLTAALGTSVATAAMALVCNPWYVSVSVPLCAGLTWFFPQYAPLTAAVGGILGSFTGPYLDQLAWEKILPVQASVLAGAACSHYVFTMEGTKASVAALGTLSLGTAAALAGMHKMFYPFFSLASVQMVATALQNYHVRSEYNGRRVRSGWYRDIPPGGQQAIFGLMVLVGMMMGRRYSHRVGLVIRDRDTDTMNLDKREGALAPNVPATVSSISG